MFYNGLFHMDTPVLADHQKLTYISSVLTWDAVQRTCQEQWMIGTVESQKGSVLLAKLDDILSKS